MDENTKKWWRFKYVQTPKILDSSKDIGFNHKIVLKTLFSFALPKGGWLCFPRNKTICKKINFNPVMIGRYLEKLFVTGFIDIENIKTKTYYIFNKPSEKLLENVMDIEKRKELALQAMESAKEKANDIKKKRLERSRIKLEKKVEKPIKDKKPRKDQEVQDMINLYRDLFDARFNKGFQSLDHKIKIHLEAKDYMVLKNRIEIYGVKVVERLMRTVFNSWDKYKVHWKIREEFPTIPMIFAFGKNELVGIQRDLLSRVPEKQEKIDDVKKPKKFGW